jgi:flagellar protein FlaJ
MNSYQRFCFNLLGKQIKQQREQYTSLRNNLLSARMKTPFEAYLSTAIITAVVGEHSPSSWRESFRIPTRR